MNLASLSTSAASIRPIFTSFSVPAAILPQRPLLMLRFPIMVGSSLVESGLLLAVLGAGFVFFAAVLFFWGGAWFALSWTFSLSWVPGWGKGAPVHTPRLHAHPH